MKNRCLYCYGKLACDETDFHEQCSKRFFGTATAPDLPYTLDQMGELAKNVVEHSVAVPGVQPKLSIGYIQDRLQKNMGRLTIVGALGGDYILKPPNQSFPGMPENEHLTMRLAGSFGIQTVESSLIRLKSEELADITKRIDRYENGGKWHMLDMFQILEAFDKYQSSMEKIGKAVLRYSDNTLLDAYRLLELILFCFLTHNNDMHLKNFSMIRRDGSWQLAPAYDLLNVGLHLPDDKEELVLTLNGKKNKLSLRDFVGFGENLGLNKKQIGGLLKRFQNAIPKWEKWIRESFMSKTLKNAYTESVRLNLYKLFPSDNEE